MRGALSARAEQILPLVRPSIELATAPATLRDLRTGDTRFGGVPDLPHGVPWPHWQGEPQAFIAQINLSQLASIPAASVLPSSGWLHFFYTARQDTWGFDPKDRGSWTVLHFGGDVSLTRTLAPDDLPREGRYQACRVTASERLTLPSWESKPVERLRLSEAEEDLYFELLESFSPEGIHQVLGHPDQVQGDMTVECQLVTHGLYTGDQSGWSDPRARQLRQGWADWQLLLQVASDDSAGMEWGDMGYLYYWIRRDDLISADFTQVWMILQCS